MPVRLRQLDQVSTQSLRRLLDEFFEIDHLVLVRVTALNDLLGLLVLDPFEAECIESVTDLRRTKRAVAVLVSGLEHPLEDDAAEWRLRSVDELLDDLRVHCDHFRTQLVQLFLAHHTL